MPLLSCRSRLGEHVWGKIRNAISDLLRVKALVDDHVERPVRGQVSES